MVYNGMASHQTLRSFDYLTRYLKGDMNLPLMKRNKSNHFMKNFSYKLIISVLVFGLIFSTAPMSGKAGISTGLVAHWELDEGIGFKANESAGIYNYDHDLFGGPKHVAGVVGRSLFFDGTNQYTQFVGTSPEETPISTFSISFWLKTTDVSADAILADDYNDFTIRLCDGGKIGIRPYKQNDTIFCAQNAVNDGAWHHVLVTHDGTTGVGQLIIDGVLEPVSHSGSEFSTIFAWPADKQIEIKSISFNRTGTQLDGMYEGYLDDVRVFNVVVVDPTLLSEMDDMNLTTEPYLEFEPNPEDEINVDNIEIGFVSQFDANLTCELDGDDVPCESPAHLTGLSDGDHVFSVTAYIDQETNNQTTISHEFEVDLPEVFVLATSTVSITTNVINNDASGASASDFTISVDAENPSNAFFVGSTASTNVIIDSATFNITGSANASYNISYSEGCSGVALPGVTYDCVVTYDDVFYVPNGGQGGDDEGGGIIPNGQGSNDDSEGDGIIPNGQGSNDNEGDGIIPNGQGSNGPEGDPVGQGSNDDEITPPGDEEEEVPVVQGENSNENNRSNGSNSTFVRKPVLALSSNTLPTLADIGSCTYINDYMNVNEANDPAEVTKLQTFLNETEGINVNVNGIFDQSTVAAVQAFQTKYLDDVMAPWGLQTATGIVSYTTKKKINEIYCKTTFSLTPEQIAEIENYKNRIATAPTTEEFVAPDDIEVGFDAPVEASTVAQETEETPVPQQQTQMASALDASGGFFDSILKLFQSIF